MTLDEMKLAVCEKLPELIEIYSKVGFWKETGQGLRSGEIINWPTEGLQVCHEAETLLNDSITNEQWQYYKILADVVRPERMCEDDWVDGHTDWMWNMCYATYEQRLEALCRVWFSEKFN